MHHTPIPIPPPAVMAHNSGGIRVFRAVSRGDPARWHMCALGNVINVRDIDGKMKPRPRAARRTKFRPKTRGGCRGKW